MRRIHHPGLFLIILGLVIALLLASVLVIRTWRIRVDRARIASTAEQIAQRAEQGRAAATADTVGGFTPQETIALFTDAVRARNDQLAASYVVPGSRVAILAMLAASDDADRDAFLDDLSIAARTSSTAITSHEFTVHEPRLVRMLRYPNGRWKFVQL